MEFDDPVLTSAPAVEEFLPRSTTTQIFSHNIAQGQAYQHNGHVYGTLHVHVHQAVGIDALQVSDAIFSGGSRIPNGLLVPRKLAKKRGKNYGEYAIRVRPGWTSWFWRVTLQKSYRGWTANLRTFNLVPHDSLIHQLCRQGDMRGVQRLLASGQASALDITPKDRLPFHDAMSSGNYEICRYLLSLTGLSRDMYPDRMIWLDFYYGCGLKSLTLSSGPSHAFMDILINTFGLDCDFLMQSESESLPWWTFCNNKDCMKLILNAVSIQYTQVSIRDRFANATLVLGSDMTWGRLESNDSFQLFLCALGGGFSYEELRWMRDRVGDTILHYIDQGKLEPTSLWRKLFKEILLQGFDAHRRNLNGKTPLIRMIAICDLLGSGFQCMLLWLQLLQECEIDLVTYGKREAKLLEPCFLLDLNHDERRHLWVDGLVYGSTPEDWDIKITAHRRIELWRPISMVVPGQWPTDDADSPRILPWKPGDRDYLYLHPSLRSSEAWVSKSINVAHELTTIRKVMQDVAEIVTVRDQHLHHQDDHGLTSLGMHRESRWRHRSTTHSRRARSEPVPMPLIVSSDDRLIDSFNLHVRPVQHHWIPWHRCAADRRWKLGFYEPRDCLWQRCGLPEAFWVNRFNRGRKHHSTSGEH